MMSWRCLVRISVVGALLSASPFALAQSIALPEKPAARVNDYSGHLTDTALHGLESKFATFEQNTGHQAVVAVFETIGDAPVEDFANKLFEKWKPGAKDRNDGILLVLALREHRVRIEVGYGLEGDLPDTLSGRIIQNDMVPFLRQDQVATAILAFEKRLEQIFITHEYATAKRQKGPSIPLVAFWVFIILAGIALLRERAGYSHTIGPNGVTRRRSRDIFWGAGGGFGGFGGGGGGWGGGGGGLSGGGGASGSW